MMLHLRKLEKEYLREKKRYLLIVFGQGKRENISIAPRHFFSFFKSVFVFLRDFFFFT